MGSDISRYVFLAVFIILASCSSEQRFKTLSLNPDQSVTVNVDKRIIFTSINGKNYDFRSDKPYPVMMPQGTNSVTVYFETSYQGEGKVKTEPYNFSIELTRGLKYKLYAMDHKDREKIKGYSQKNETFLVHYYLKSDDGIVHSFKSSCSIRKIDLETIKCLINNRENLDRRYGRNRDIAIIHHVVINNLKESLVLLLDAGADPNRKSRAKGYTPLHYAVKMNSLTIVKILTEKRAGVNLKNNDGQTPLHTAIIEGYSDIAEYLIKKGANPYLRDKKGLRPYDYAKRSKNKKIRSLFKKKKKAVKKDNSSRKKIPAVKKKKSTLKKSSESKKTRKIVKKKVRKRRKPLDEEDRLPKRENPIPSLKCSTQECFASIADIIETALRKKRYSKLETDDLKKVAYIYFQISKLCKRTTPKSAIEEFGRASELFRSMGFGKRKLHITRRRIIKKAEEHVTKAARLIVADAEKKIQVLQE